MAAIRMGPWFAVCALAALLFFAVPATAGHVNCGDTITTDTTLDSDLLNCSADGVIIGADDITLDLNGNLIDGSSTRPGVNNEAGYDGVTVADGEIRDFAAPVSLQDASENTIEHITTNGSRFQITDSSDNVLRRNAGRAGVFIFGNSDRNIVERNVIENHDISLIANTFTVEYPDDNVIAMNVITGGDAATINLIHAIRTVIARNDVTSAATLTGPMSISQSASTVVERNRIRGGDFGVVVGGFSTSTSLIGNDVSGALFDGISILNTTNTVLDGNTSSQNGEDGIDVESSSTTITKNTANDNGDYGIEAVPGVTDGGGNKARGNGNPAQCLNVSCH